MFGAPWGGTTRLGHEGVDSRAFSLMIPSNGCGGGGRYLPSMVVVALGSPVVPVLSCAVEFNWIRSRGITLLSTIVVFIGFFPQVFI
jgi:hypothetical protein